VTEEHVEKIANPAGSLDIFDDVSLAGVSTYSAVRSLGTSPPATSPPATVTGTVAEFVRRDNQRQRASGQDRLATENADLKEELAWAYEELASCRTYCEELILKSSRVTQLCRNLQSELAAEKRRAQQRERSSYSLLENQNRDLSMLLRYQMLGHSSQLPSFGAMAIGSADMEAFPTQPISFGGPAPRVFSPHPAQASYQSVPRYSTPTRGWQATSPFPSEPPSTPVPPAQSPSAAPSSFPESPLSPNLPPSASSSGDGDVRLVNGQFQWPQFTE
jgi:hypothetical protein